MKCPKCSEDVRDSERNCRVCDYDCGYPNVRAAERPEEIKALEERLGKAEAAAASRGCGPVLARFRQAVCSSEAVLSRNLSAVMHLVSTDNELYVSYYDLVGMGARRPEDTPIEVQRRVTDELLFPQYRDKIRFVALTLNGIGVTRFGNCSVVLKQAAVQDRTTVFEENSVRFADKHDLGVKRHRVPTGFRATWGRRDQLAAAKLEPEMEPGMEPEAFPSVMMKEGKTWEDDQFIEVHIYGPLHRRSIARLRVAESNRRADKTMLLELQRILKPLGAAVDIVNK